MKITYRERYFIDRFRCVDYEHTDRCDAAQWMGNLLYTYRGGYVWRCFAREDVIRIEN